MRSAASKCTVAKRCFTYASPARTTSSFAWATLFRASSSSASSSACMLIATADCGSEAKEREKHLSSCPKWKGPGFLHPMRTFESFISFTIAGGMSCAFAIVFDAQRI